MKIENFIMRHLFRKYRGHIWSYIAAASLFTLTCIWFLVFRTMQVGVIYPNTYIGDINFGGKTKEDAQQILYNKGQAILEKGIILSVKGKNAAIMIAQYASDPDLTRELVKFNAGQIADELYEIGRDPYNIFSNFRSDIQAMFFKREVKASVEFNQKELISYLKDKLGDYETLSKNAAIVYDGDLIKIKKEVAGQKIDYQNLLKKLEAQLQNLQSPYITASIIPDVPLISQYEIEDRVLEIETALARAPLTIKYSSESWSLDKNDLKKYLEFTKIDDVPALVISKEKTAAFFKKIADKINIPARDAKFQIKDGKVSEFQTSRLGLKLDADGTLSALNNILSNGYPVVNLVMDSESPQITTANANSLGITDFLGRGETDFAGSPANRMHNIKTGVEKLNGLLFKPGEIFSTLKAIGSIDEENGFKKELVIKGDRTIPEFGGGLCQVSTTLFRAALASGLPIVERRSHTYRVSYYEPPAGIDATIYNPSTDLKFLNDTKNYILIQARVEGTKIIFEFWGKKDGRETSYTNPVVSNITNPPPVKYIYTADLPAGQKKKIETAHKGADAYFKYTIKYPDERGSVEKIFTSRYKPWAEVWLVGATSTPESGI